MEYNFLPISTTNRKVKIRKKIKTTSCNQNGAEAYPYSLFGMLMMLNMI
jgi:hypothetical protein